MSQCVYCGSRTGLHGFSFNNNGSYKSEFEDAVLDYEERVKENRPYEDTTTLEEFVRKYLFGNPPDESRRIHRNSIWDDPKAT